MKKIISVLAMALLVTGAAQAQVRKKYVHLNNDSILKFKVADIQEVTFEMDYAPNTIEEAQAILLSSYWKMDSPLEYDGGFYDNYEGSYITIGGDPIALYWFKVKDSPADANLAPYAGKYIFTGISWYLDFKTPTEFLLWNQSVLWFNGTNLMPDSFDLTTIVEPTTYHCVRVEPFDPSEIVQDPDL